MRLTVSSGVLPLPENFWIMGGMKHLFNVKSEELEDWLRSEQQPKFRHKQILQWAIRNRVGGFDEMTNLPKTLRDALTRDFSFWSANVVRHEKAADQTEKLLLELRDGGRIECVLIREGTRRTVCISTQVGCAMGCVFCASGLDGVDRNLTAGEIVEQLQRLQLLLPPEERISHIVVMGMGEPLANLQNLLSALDVATHPDRFGISTRRITISTVGLPSAIEQLAEEKRHFHLAVSLHAPNDELRNQLVPVNKKIGISQIMSAAEKYFVASGRRLTFEYVLLADLNDQKKHAQQLARLLQNTNALLNVIPYNPVAGLPYRTPSDASIRQFRSVLERANINLQFRQKKGDDINAACGQLRRTSKDKEIHQIESSSTG